MQLSQFDYILPPERIAQHPLEKRSHSRLLVLKQNQGIQDTRFDCIGDSLNVGDLLVFNDSRVLPARLFGHKSSGGKVEVLIERLLPHEHALCYIRASKAPKENSELLFAEGHSAQICARHGDQFEIRFRGRSSLVEYMQQHGHMPLPPYITRTDEHQDRERYQTVYARNPGAIAAPTAGLHFDEVLLRALHARGVRSTFLTLHVGAGTFQPVRTQDITSHKMHSEWVNVSATVCEAVLQTQREGGRVIAVGTTVVRSLESASQGGVIAPFCGETSIFITPGYVFKCVDALITNFHLPRSTLLMLVCAFGGYQKVMRAYQHAIAEGYRFYSYGDAMYIEGSKTDGGAYAV